MAQLTTRRLYADGTTPTQEQLDAFVDDIETFVNLTKLNDDNFVNAGITASTKVDDDSTIDAKFANGSITTAKIADSNVTTAKLAADSVTTAKIADSNVTTAKIADSNVTTAKIADGAVTTAKTAPNYTTVSISSPSVTSTASFSNFSTNISGSITTNGNPVELYLSGGYFTLYDNTGTNRQTFHGQIKVVRTTSGVDTDIATFDIYNKFDSASSTVNTFSIPAGALFMVDTPSAGTHTYRIQGKVILHTSGTVLQITSSKFVIWEI